MEEGGKVDDMKRASKPMDICLEPRGWEPEADARYDRCQRLKEKSDVIVAGERNMMSAEALHSRHSKINIWLC